LGGKAQATACQRPTPGRWILDAFGLHHEEAYDQRLLAKRVAVYRQGVFEWAQRYRGGQPQLPGRTLADDVHDVLRYAAGVFAELDYFGRLSTDVRIENAEEYRGTICNLIPLPQCATPWTCFGKLSALRAARTLTRTATGPTTSVPTRTMVPMRSAA
jgi:hypothetical protein